MTDRDYLKTLPLLLVGGVAFVAGALIFFNKGDVTASISAMTLGVILVSMWATTAIADWAKARKRAKEEPLHRGE